MNIEQFTSTLKTLGISENKIVDHINKIRQIQKKGQWSPQIADEYVDTLKILNFKRIENELSDIIRDFALYYRSIKTGPFQYDELIKEFLKNVTGSITNLVPGEDEFIVKASVGQGAWAEIPWIAIMHRGITESTQSGYYVVLLFSKNLDKIFVSLGLGWTQFTEIFGGKLAKKNANLRTSMLRDKVSINNQDIAGDLNLDAETQRGKGYEMCNIVAREILLKNLNDDDLISVIQNYLGKYKELRNEFGADLFYDLDSEKLFGYDLQDIQNKVKKASSRIDKKDAIKGLVAIANTQTPEKRVIYSRQIIRNRAFADYVKSRSDYVCEVCGRLPFKKKDGTLYAEADHIDALYLKGKDHPDNMRCLCALCHRIITYGSKTEVEKLLAK